MDIHQQLKNILAEQGPLCERRPFSDVSILLTKSPFKPLQGDPSVHSVRLSIGYRHEKEKNMYTCSRQETISPGSGRFAAADRID